MDYSSLHALLNLASQQTEIPSYTDEGSDTRFSESSRGEMKEDTDSLTNDFLYILLAVFKLYHVVMILFTSGQQGDLNPTCPVSILNVILQNSSW